MTLSHQYSEETFSSRQDSSFGLWLFFTFYLTLLVLLTTSSFYNFFSDNSLIVDGKTAGAANNKLYLLMWVGLYAMTGLGFMGLLLRQGVASRFLWAMPLVLWVILSVSWSVSFSTTLYFGVMFIMLVLMAYVVSETITPERVFKIMATIFAVLLLLSLVGFVLFPEQTSSVRYGGGWLVNTEMFGIYSHKSDAGYFFALIILLMISAKDIGLRWSVVVRFCVIILAVLGIILANSATALASALLLSSVYLLMPLVSYSKTVLYLLGSILLLFAVIVPYIDIGQFAQLIGRDAGLTGRDEIWANGLLFIQKELVVGYGYYGFFDTDVFSPVWDLWEQFDFFLTPHFHNSGMDITISLGVIGLALYIFVVVQAFRILDNGSIVYPLRLILFLALLLFVMTSAFDFTLMKHNHFATFFLFYVFFTAQKSHYQEMTGGAGDDKDW